MGKTPFETVRDLVLAGEIRYLPIKANPAQPKYFAKVPVSKQVDVLYMTDKAAAAMEHLGLSTDEISRDRRYFERDHDLATYGHTMSIARAEKREQCLLGVFGGYNAVNTALKDIQSVPARSSSVSEVGVGTLQRALREGLMRRW